MSTPLLPDSLTPARVAADIGIVVANLEKALQFYRDLIGLPVVAELNTSLIGKGKMVQLRHGASLVKLVELASSPELSSGGDINAALGLRYLTLMVEDIERIAGRLEQARVVVVQPLFTLNNGAMIYMVQDPDGNVVEFVQEAR